MVSEGGPGVDDRFSLKEGMENPEAQLIMKAKEIESYQYEMTDFIMVFRNPAPGALQRVIRAGRSARYTRSLCWPKACQSQIP